MPSGLMVVVARSVIGPSKPSVVMLLDQEPFGRPRDFRQHGCAALGADVLGQLVERFELELLHHLDQALAADVVAGGQRVDVADRVDRLARIGADHRHQGLVDLACSSSLRKGM